MTGRYHFYVLDDEGRTAAHRERDCSDDPAALEIARSFSNGQPVEVWNDDRCVAQIVESNEGELRCYP